MSKLLQERWNRLAFAPNSTTVRINETDEAHPNSKIYDQCQDGYRKVAGKSRGEKGSCELDEHDETLTEKDQKGMWHYINKNKAEGKPPKKPGDPGYPSEESWKANTSESDETLEETDEIQETDENPFMAKIAHAAVDGEEKVIIGDKEYDVDMDPDVAEEITGEKVVEEAISRWYRTINESGFDKEKKDKMKCNTPRRLRDGEPGKGEKSKVVKACDPGSDKETIVKFGDPDMPVQSHHSDNKSSFRARHKCDDKTMDKDWNKAGYWSCKEW